ncbi:hypothetical protein [Novosphingobium olei]|uniref:hypothetical protein n=1 Tax=Novosphingobium olei TaxID=2728851 RepID=UPI003091069A|nr:hypothetical protein NSDW_20090 [Novosphingobium olei]
MKAVAVSIGLAVSLATPAFGQIPSSSAEVRGIPDAKAYVQGALELRRLASCATEKRPNYVHTMLDSIPQSDTEVRVGQAILKVIETCMTDFRPAMSVGFAQLRGSLAEELYLADHKTPTNFAQLDHGSKKLPAAWISAKLTRSQASEIVAQDFAQCVVSDAPELADALLRTLPRSSEEQRALAKLAPNLGPCLASGHTFSMDAAAVRSYVAQALYRGVNDWPPAAAAGGK